jgi:hypothetical protein
VLGTALEACWEKNCSSELTAHRTASMGDARLTLWKIKSSEKVLTSVDYERLHQTFERLHGIEH